MTCFNYIELTFFVAYPRSQNELIKMARGTRSQREFAELLCVDKTCLSRYENGKLGAPVAVINQCLALVAQACESEHQSPDVQQALRHAKLAVTYLSPDTNITADLGTPKSGTPK
nr:hypothetical protein MS308 [uncultured bacterium]